MRGMALLRGGVAARLSISSEVASLLARAVLSQDASPDNAWTAERFAEQVRRLVPSASLSALEAAWLARELGFTVLFMGAREPIISPYATSEELQRLSESYQRIESQIVSMVSDFLACIPDRHDVALTCQSLMEALGDTIGRTMSLADVEHKERAAEDLCISLRYALVRGLQAGRRADEGSHTEASAPDPSLWPDATSSP